MKCNLKELITKVESIVGLRVNNFKPKFFKEGLSIKVKAMFFVPIITYLHFDENLVLYDYKLLNDYTLDFDSLIGITLDLECDFDFVLSSNDRDITGYIKDGKLHRIDNEFYENPVLYKDYDRTIIDYVLDKYKDNIDHTYSSVHLGLSFNYEFIINDVTARMSIKLDDGCNTSLSANGVTAYSIEHFEKLIKGEFNTRDKIVKSIGSFDSGRDYKIDEDKKTVAIGYNGYNGDPKRTYTYYFDEDKMEVRCIDNRYNNRKKVPFEEKKYTENMRNVWLSGNELKKHKLDVKIKETTKQLEREEKNLAYHKENYDYGVKKCDKLECEILKLQIEKDNLCENSHTELDKLKSYEEIELLAST